MAYEICSECRVKQVPRGHYICEDCEARLVEAELTPAAEAKKGFFGRAKQPAEPIIISEEDEPEPLSPWRILLRGVRMTAVAAVVLGTFVFGWDVYHNPPKTSAMDTPPFILHMQDRTRAIVGELTGALTRQ